LNALRDWVKKTFGKVSEIEIKGYRFWVERG
jgi:hypothetical protein